LSTAGVTKVAPHLPPHEAELGKEPSSTVDGVVPLVTIGVRSAGRPTRSPTIAMCGATAAGRE
jgi:hypothetical protein